MTIAHDILIGDGFSLGVIPPIIAKPRRTEIIRRDIIVHDSALLKFPGSEVPSQSRIIQFGNPFKPWDDIYREMPEKDPDLAGMIDRFIWSVIALDREIVPHIEPDGTITDGAQEAADLCSEWFELMGRNATTMAEEWWLWKYFQGSTFTEFNWDDTGSLPFEIKQREMHRFAFTHGEKGQDEFILNYRTSGGLKPAPVGKFLHTSYGIRGAPYRYGLAEKYYWYWKLKLYALLDWATFVEAWADPVVKVKYNAAEPQSDKEKEAAENNLRERKALEIALGRYGNGAIVHDHDMEVGLLESTRQGVQDTFRGVYEVTARAIARLVHLESTTSGSGDRSAASPLSAMKVTRNISQDRTIVVSQGLGDTWGIVFGWITSINLPGAPVPGMTLKMSSTANEMKEVVTESLDDGFPDSGSNANTADQLIEEEVA